MTVSQDHVDGAPSRLPVEDSSSVPLARALAARAAAQAGLSPDAGETVALAATELAENLHRHAVGGELLVVPGASQPVVTRRPGPALWLLAVDRGPGVERFERCLVDGYSTSGTLGSGLGAVRRLATAFDAVSEPGRGTVVAAGFEHADAPADAGPDPDEGAAPALDAAALGFPISGELVNGDGAAVAVHGGRVVALLADGLGHGPDAARASGAATAALGGLAALPPAELVAGVSRRLVGTRGAAVTVAGAPVVALREGGALTGAGLGNVSLLVAGPDGSGRRSATSHGTAGARAPAPVAEREHVLPPGGVVVLHSDGLTTRWGLEDRAELLRHRALVVCAAVLRDHARGTDDTMVVVVKAGRGAR